MSLSNPLRRLLRIRQLEEEQGRLVLEAVLAEVSQIASAQAAETDRAKLGRQMVAHGARSASLTERIAGLEECRMADAASGSLNVRLTEVEERAANVREHFVTKRMQRMQAQMLVDQSDARAKTERERKQQQDLDDWHLSR